MYDYVLDDVYPPKQHLQGQCLLTFGQAGCPSFNCLCPLSVNNTGHRTSENTPNHVVFGFVHNSYRREKNSNVYIVCVYFLRHKKKVP